MLVVDVTIIIKRAPAKIIRASCNNSVKILGNGT